MTDRAPRVVASFDPEADVASFDFIPSHDHLETFPLGSDDTGGLLIHFDLDERRHLSSIDILDAINLLPNEFLMAVRESSWKGFVFDRRSDVLTLVLSGSEQTRSPITLNTDLIGGLHISLHCGTNGRLARIEILRARSALSPELIEALEAKTR